MRGVGFELADANDCVTTCCTLGIDPPSDNHGCSELEGICVSSSLLLVTREGKCLLESRSTTLCKCDNHPSLVHLSCTQGSSREQVSTMRVTARIWFVS